MFAGMREGAHPQPTPGTDPVEEFLKRIDLRMERRNRRLLANLTAWAEILDALGWHVALWLPGREPLLSARAREWSVGQSEKPLTWEEISARLAAAPPARQLVKSAQVRVWAAAEPESHDAGHRVLFETLTAREAEVLDWLRAGKTGPEISIILGCARRTVESHVARIYRKIGVHGRAQLHFQTAPAAD